jgi:flagellar biosynthesis protein FlhG
MSDQAQKLRLLVNEASPAADAVGGELPMVVVTGARAGVGATTVALNLAAVLADRGERVLLVDGAEQRNAVPESAGVRGDVRYGLADVLAGKCDVDDAIVQGPAGVQMLLNRWSAHKSADYSRNAQQRMLSELQSLSERFDLILVDSGRGLTPWSRRFWSRAKLNLLVTTPDDGAILDAYAILKLAMAEGAEQRPIRLLVNQADGHAAADAQRRMENACQKFLLRSIPALPALPRSFDCGFAGVSAAPRVWEMPNTPFGHAALWLGRAVNDLLANEVDDMCATAGLSSSVDWMTACGSN